MGRAHSTECPERKGDHLNSKPETNRIILAGGTGFLGKLLHNDLAVAGHEMIVLTRTPSATGEVQWDGQTMGPWASQLDGAFAVINLAGKSVNCRYHKRNRQLIMNSRIESTRVLGEAIRRCQCPPRVWLNSSTATIYQHSIDRDQDEHSTEFNPTPEAKDAFSVSVATAWEKAFAEAIVPGTRKVALRISMVLGTEPETVFRVLHRLTRLGLGGRMGRGNQYVSWIHEFDFGQAVKWLLGNEKIEGPVNLSAPCPVPNKEMMRLFRHVCHRCVGLPASRWMLEVGAFLMRTETELVLKSRRVAPRRLLDSGFSFQFHKMQEALQDLVAKLEHQP